MQEASYLRGEGAGGGGRGRGAGGENRGAVAGGLSRLRAAVTVPSSPHTFPP